MQSTTLMLQKHLQALADRNLEQILEHYTDDTVLFTVEGPVRGKTELREWFARFLTSMPDGMMDNFEILRQDVEGEIAFLVWHARPTVPMGTDTFIVRDGKIAIQTFAAAT